VTAHELEKARRQLRARLVFENDSITNIAHQLGYFETIASWNLCLRLGAGSTQ
jgi:predicted Zn-dependent peptidase